MSGGAFMAVLRRDLLLAMRRKSEVLTAVFGDNFAFDDATHVDDNIPARHFASFKAAAEELRVTPTSVSNQIRQLEQRQHLPAVPIIALTAHIFDEYRQQGQAAGMDDFIGKPLDSQLLYDTLERFLPEVMEP